MNNIDLQACLTTPPTQPFSLLIPEETTDDQFGLMADQPEVLVLVEQLHCLRVGMGASGAQKFFASPMPNMHTMIIEKCPISVGVIEAFSNNETLTALKTFHCLYTPGADEDAWPNWVNASWWKQLETLRIHCTDFNNNYANTLTWYDGLLHMTTIDIQSDKVSDMGAKWIAQTPLNPNLKSFTFDGRLLTSEGYNDLLSIPNLPQASRDALEVLANKEKGQDELFGDLRAILREDLKEDHHRTALLHFLYEMKSQDPEQFQEAVLPYVKSLRQVKWPRFFEVEYSRLPDLSYVCRVLDFVQISLELTDPEDGDVNWIKLSKSPYLQQVHSINAWEQAITTKDTKALAKSKHLTNLEHFAGFHELTESEFTTLLSSPNFSRIQGLDMSYSNWTMKVMEAFAGSSITQHIEWLNLCFEEEADDVLHRFVALDCPALTVLVISGSQQQEQTLNKLTNASWFRQLCVLDLRDCNPHPELMTHLLKHGVDEDTDEDDALKLCIYEDMEKIQTSPYLEAQYKKGRISFDSAQMLD